MSEFGTISCGMYREGGVELGDDGTEECTVGIVIQADGGIDICSS